MRPFRNLFDFSVSEDTDTQFLVHASYIEIYNEEIRDLLGENHEKRMELKESPDEGVYVKGM